MKKLSEIVFNPEIYAQDCFEKFRDKIEASKLYVIERAKSFNYQLEKDHAKNKRLKVDFIDETTILVFVRETGYQVLTGSRYIKLSKAVKNKLDANYILY